MIVRQISIKNYACFQGAIKIKALKEQELQKSPEIREFKKMQYKGVDPKEVEEIAHFLTECIQQDKEHFIGTLTFGWLLQNGEEIPFRALSLKHDQQQFEDIDALNNIGFLQTQQSTWILIDGLHRYYSVLKTLAELPPHQRKVFENEEIPVILVPCVSLDQLRDLMLRLQKSVRSVDRGEVIRTASHDYYAQFARKLCGIEGTIDGHQEWVLHEKLVNWKSNTITNRLQKFTTLSVLYDSAKILYPDLDKQSLSSQEFSSRYKNFAEIWKMLIERFHLFNRATRFEEDIPELRNKYICLKATGQLVIFQVIQIALRNEGQSAIEQTIERLNHVPWETNNSFWEGILITDKRLKSGYAAKNLAAYLIAYYISVSLSEREIHELGSNYQKMKGKDLPSPYNQRHSSE